MKYYSAHVSGSPSAGMNRPPNTIARGACLPGTGLFLLVAMLIALAVLVVPVAAADGLTTVSHGNLEGSVYVESTTNWASKLSTNTFAVPNGTVVWAGYYVGVWTANWATSSIATTFNGHSFETKPPSYNSGMGVSWISYNATDYVTVNGINTAIVDSSSWGDGRQYGTTLVVVLKNESMPQTEYWVAEGLSWLHYDSGSGADEHTSTIFTGTVDPSNVQNANLHSVHLTGFNYEDLNGNALPAAAKSTGGEYFNYLRWDGVQGLLVPGSQTVNVALGSDSYCSPVLIALTVVNKTPDLLPVSLTPSIITAGSENTLTATIENRGGRDASAFYVKLLNGETVLSAQSVTSLASGSTTTVNFTWTPLGNATSYILTVVVDPDNRIDENNESNSLAVLVGTSLAITPVAEFTADKTSGDAPLTVSFSDQSTNSPIVWSWDFENDGIIDSTEKNPTHIYTIPANYPVSLTVGNAAGTDTETKTNYITVSAIVPVADFTATPASGIAPLTVQFNDTSANVPTSWSWDFENDGIIDSTEKNPTHTYTVAGKHTVSLTAGNAAGTNSKVKSSFITAYGPPVANFSGTPLSGTTPLTVTFTDRSENVPSSWLWDFGDGSTSTSQNPSHRYSYGGNYSVSLNVTNPAGSNSTSRVDYISTIMGVGPVWTASAWSAPGNSGDLADLDNDGDLDLMNVYSAFENTGNASSPVWMAKPAWNLPTTVLSSHPAFADLDSDGDVDVLVGNMYGWADAYENTGNVSSPVWTSKPAWNMPDFGNNDAFPVLADLDDDGDYDILAGSYTNLYRYENTGTVNSPAWTATSAWTYSGVSGNCPMPVISDLDGDGDYDLFITYNNGNTYALENTGNATRPSWTAKADWNPPTGSGLQQPIAADLDNDGDDDLLLTAGATTVYENTGYIPLIPNADFGAIPINGGAPLSVQFIDRSTKNATIWAWDFENDGIIDSAEKNPAHIYSDKGKYTVNLTVGNAAGTNSQKKTGIITVYLPPVANFSATPVSGNQPLTVTFSDLSENQPLSWLWDFGDGSTSTSQNPAHAYIIAGNYTVNLTVTNPAGSSSLTRADSITVLVTIGPVYLARSSWDVPSVGMRAAPTFADLDGDGDSDLLIGEKTGNTYGYENTGSAGSPTWTAKATWNAPDIGDEAVLSVADLDGDGDYDILIGGKTGITYGYENTGSAGSPAWTAKSTWNAPDIGDYAGPSFADLDDDGDYDILIGGKTGITYGYENTGSAGSPSWTAKSAWNAPDIGDYAGPSLADLDGDGDYDLMIGSSAGITNGYENTGNTGSPAWTAKATWNTPDTGARSKPAWADLDADGDYDLLVGDSSGITYGYQNVGSLPPAVPTISFIGVPTSGAAPLTVNFTDTSKHLPTTWAWSFGDGTTSSLQNPVHTYVTAGNYTVNLTATNSVGSSSKVQAEYIKVGGALAAPVAGFTSDVTNGTAPLTVNFTDQSTGTPTSWLWDFGDNDTSSVQNPSHTYTAAGTYTVNLTVTGAGGSTSAVKTGLITVTSPGADIIISAGPVSSSSPSPNLLAHYTANIIKATVRNQGTQSAGSFNVTFNVNGNLTSVNVAGLGAGSSTVVNTTDTVDRSVGAFVPVIVIADAEVAVAESNKTNNQYFYNATVIRNGYAGMRWGDGPDITTTKVTTLHGDIVYSLGNSAYGSGSAAWTAGDLPIPAGATVKDARLYITYCWDSGNVMPGAAVTSFNGVSKSYESFYSDKKNWGGYAYPFGVIIYNVTDQFNTSGNSVSATGIPPIRGMELVVTYEDPTATEKQIFVNEGFDLLYASPSYYTTEETATAYAPFTGASITLGNVKQATLTTFINRGGSGITRGTMFFNGEEYPNYWTIAGPEIGVNTTDVTAYLKETGNTVAFRSLVANNMDMEPHLAILKVERKGGSTATLSATSASGIGRNQNGTIGIYLNNSFSPKAGSLTVQLYYNESILSAQAVEVMADGVAPTNLSSPITIAIATASGIPNGNAWLANVTFRSGQDTEVTSALGLALITLTDTSIPPQDLRGMTRIQNGTFTTGGGIQIQVVGADGNPVIADRIALEGGAVPFSVTNTSSHRFSAVPAGTYQLTVTKAGHISVNTTIHYAAGSVRELTATLVTHAYQPTVILAENGVSLAGMTHTAPEQLNALRNETDQYNLTLNGGGVVSVALEYPMRFQLNQPQVTSPVPVGTEMRNGTFLWTNPSYTTTNATLVVTAVPASGQSPLGLLLTGGKLGDVYYNGQITSTDSLYILHYVVGNLKSLPTYDYADITRDGKITSTDALYILHYVVGNVNEYYRVP